MTEPNYFCRVFIGHMSLKQRIWQLGQRQRLVKIRSSARIFLGYIFVNEITYHFYGLSAVLFPLFSFLFKQHVNVTNYPPSFIHTLHLDHLQYLIT